jgi:flagellar basal-body rod protein FlgF
MLTQEIKMDLVTNNLANVNTNGYKGNEAALKSFPQHLIHRLNDSYLKVSGVEGTMDTRPLVGLASFGSVVDEITINFQKGDLTKTDNKTDVAIDGTGFFVVQTPFGERMTRDGAFVVNANRELVNNEGYRVMGQNGPIMVDGRGFNVDEKGVIFDGEKGDHLVDRLQVVTVDDLKTIKKIGHNLFMVPLQHTQPHAAADNEFTIRQSVLEKSNVNAVTMLRNMIDVMRTYEANSKMIATEDSLMGRASEIGRVG